MVVCSCSIITTENIRKAVTYVTEPNEKMVLNMLNWESNCGICTKTLVAEIRKVIEEVTNGGEL